MVFCEHLKHCDSPRFLISAKTQGGDFPVVCRGFGCVCWSVGIWVMVLDCMYSEPSFRFRFVARIAAEGVTTLPEGYHSICKLAILEVKVDVASYAPSLV